MTETLDRLLVSSRRNRMLNPGMRISQENVNTAVTGGAGLVYPVDGLFSYVGTTAGATAICQQIAKPTPGGSPNRVRVTVGTAFPTVGATDNASVGGHIEGIDVADLAWGTAAAKAVTARLGFNTSVPGTYAFVLKNSASDRSYVVPFTISPAEVNTDLLRTFLIPGPTTGTWLIDTGRGIAWNIALMCGSAFQGAANSWVNSNVAAPANIINFFATSGNVFEVFDIGLYEGYGLPPFELLDIGDELRRCQRYYEKSYPIGVKPGSAAAGASFSHTVDAATTYASIQVPFKVEKRVYPSVTLYNPVSGAQGQACNTNTGLGLAAIANVTDVNGTTVLVNNVSVAATHTVVVHMTANARL
jgi:hypothetical protein